MSNKEKEYRHDNVSVEEIEKDFYYDSEQRDLSEAEVFSRWGGAFKWLLIAFLAIPAIYAVLYFFFLN